MKQFLPIILSVLVIGTSLAVTNFRAEKQEKYPALPTSPMATLIPQTNTPTPDELPGWDIYTNRQYNFSIRIPESWLTDESKTKPFDLKLKVYPQRWQGQQLPWATSANITVDPSQSAKKEFNRFKNRQEPEILNNKIEEITFSGQDCLRVTSQLPGEGGFGPRVLCLKDNRIYQLQVFAFYPPATEKDLAEKTLDTFIFLDQ